MVEVLSKEQWEAWHRQEETQAFREYLQREIELAMGAWAAGQFTAGRGVQEIAVANLAAVENVQFARRLIEMDYDDYIATMKEQ